MAPMTTKRTKTPGENEEDSLESIATEARAIDSLRMQWRTFDKKTALALRRRISALDERIETLRERTDPDADPDHDELHEHQEPLADAAEDVRRALRALKLVSECQAIPDDTFLDWLQSCARDGLPVHALWERATQFFGKSRGRAERIFADEGRQGLPDPAQAVPLLESAAEQGDGIAAARLMYWQSERRDHWRARAIALRDQATCLEEGIELVRPPRRPERLGRAAELFSWVIAGAPGRFADEACAYLRCLHELGWVEPDAPRPPPDFRASDVHNMSRIRKLFGL